MKKGVILFLCAVMLFCALSVPAVAASQSVLYESTIDAIAAFSITNNVANIRFEYETNPQFAIECVEVTTTLQKRVLLVFWDTQCEWTNYCYTSSELVWHTYNVGSGHYRVKFHYAVHMADGTVDETDRIIEANN